MSAAAPGRGSETRPPGAQRCLLTGATGFIGGHLAERLTGEGYAVRCLVRASSDTTRLRALDAELTHGDLASGRPLTDAVDGCELVVHCGALVSDWAATRELVATNVGGTRRLLAACADAGVRRVVHLSSTDVYGYPGSDEVDEGFTSARFRNWYADTKRAAEAEVRHAETTHGLAVAILRPATVFGPGSVDVVGEIARAIRGRHMVLVDGGRPIAGLCYVQNLIDAAILALRHPSAPGHAFNVSDGLQVTWKRFTDDLAAGLRCPPVRWSVPYRLARNTGHVLELAYRLVHRATGLSTPPLLSRQAVDVLGTSQSFDNTRLRETLGWAPRVGYEEALGATIAWLQGERSGARPARA